MTSAILFHMTLRRQIPRDSNHGQSNRQRGPDGRTSPSAPRIEAGMLGIAPGGSKLPCAKVQQPVRLNRLTQPPHNRW